MMSHERLATTPRKIAKGVPQVKTPERRHDISKHKVSDKNRCVCLKHRLEGKSVSSPATLTTEVT